MKLCLSDPLPDELRAWTTAFVITDAQPRDEPHLWYHNGCVKLVFPDDDLQGCWVTSAELKGRLSANAPLARACGVVPGRTVHVADVMAGWGVDGLLLARLGARVDLVDVSKVATSLCVDLLLRLGLSKQVSVYVSDCGAWMASQDASSVDVVYLDPMFPIRGKTALPRKRMQYLSRVVHAAPVIDADVVDYLDDGLRIARDRVVIKRRLKDPPLGVSPNWQIRNKTVRYDVFKASV